MKRITETFLLIILFVGLLPVIYSQSTGTTAVERQRERQVALDLEQRRARMRQLESPRRGVTRPKISAEDREISKESWEWIREMRKVGVDDLRSHGGFLKNKNTGIFRLFPNFDCVSKNVMRVDGPCEDFVPATSDYSFRKRDFVNELFHDLELNNGYFISDGFFSHGVMVSLGNVPIDKITSDPAGLTFLSNFRPAKTLSDARSTSYRLRQGILSNGFIYADRLAANEETTYALRVIAYRGHNAARNSAVDDRKDITVVFRVVRASPDGGLTIIWKEIKKTSAPELKFSKGEVPADFKPI